MRLYLLCLVIFLVPVNTSAQSYYKGLQRNRITVNSADQTVVAFTNPVKASVAPNRDKLYFWYSANDIRSTQGGYSGKPLNGLYTAFYLNKNLKAKGEFGGGLKHGKWKSWYENGQLSEVASWKSGIKTGPFYEYSESGELKKKGKYKSGKLHGKIITYVSPDSTQVSKYKSGVAVVSVKKEKSVKTKNKNRIQRFFADPLGKKKKPKEEETSPVKKKKASKK